MITPLRNEGRYTNDCQIHGDGRLDAHVAIRQDRAHRVAHDPVAVVLVVEHAFRPAGGAERAVVRKADRLRVHVARVDQLRSDHDDVVGDGFRVCAAAVERVDIGACGAASLGEVDEHLAPDERDVMRPERSLRACTIDRQRRAHPLRDPQRLEEGGLLRLVLRTGVLRTQLNAAYRVGRVGSRKAALAHGRRDRREFGPRRIVGRADQDDVAGRGDGRSELSVRVGGWILWIDRRVVIQDHVEQDHPGVEARQIVDHLGVI